MSTETNKAIVRRHIDYIWNQYRMDLYTELFAEDVIHHENLQTKVGVEPMKVGRKIAQEAFPDIHYTIEDEIAVGEKVVLRSTVRSTHTGEFIGLAPTGNEITVSVLAIYRLANAKIVEVWFCYDQLGMMQQLGAVPTPQSA